MTTELFIATTDTEIESCFPVFSVLRSHVVKEDFLAQVRRQQDQSYQILALRQENMVKVPLASGSLSFWHGGKCFISTT